MKKDHFSRNYESEIEVAFRCFDRHGNGFISRQELGHIFQVREERKFLPCSFYI
jgi:Ca2+-binding EF-hand superfamily protein